MKKIIFDKITKDEFLKIDEKDIIFITNPGRMGDEDGINFIIKENDKYKPYRVSGWAYGSNMDDPITFQDARNQFPEWMETWNNWNNEDYKGKYKYLYMGFGNGLCIDNSIYDIYYNYLLEEVKKSDKYIENPDNNYDTSINISIWDKAIISMCLEEGIEINIEEKEEIFNEDEYDIPPFLRNRNEDE